MPGHCDKPEPDFTMDDLLRELEAMLAPAEDGMTTKELARALNLGEAAVRSRLHKLMEQGRLIRVRKRITRIDDVELSVTAYKLKEVRQDGADH